MRELADGLFQLRGRPKNVMNVYLMGDVIVDSAVRQSAKRIVQQVQGRTLRALVLTHGHIDHMGAMHEVCETLGLPLRCGEGDVAAAESGMRAGLKDRPWIMRVEHRFWMGEGHPVSEPLREGDEVGGFTVFETPGHSPGHVAFWRERDRVLVLGDVLFGLDPRTGRPGPHLPPNVFTPDPAQNLASARRLAALEPRLVCFGHGPPLRDMDRLQRFVASAEV